MHYQIIAYMHGAYRSSCLTQQLSEVRLYRLKLLNQNLNTVRSVVLPSFEREI